MRSIAARTYHTNYFQRLTLESWYTNLQQTPLNRFWRVPAPYKRLICIVNESDKRTLKTSNRPIWLTKDGLKPTNYKLYMSLLANTIKAKLINLFKCHGKQAKKKANSVNKNYSQWASKAQSKNVFNLLQPPKNWQSTKVCLHQYSKTSWKF